MVYIQGHDASATSTTAVVLTVELIGLLVEKGILNIDDVRAVLLRQAAELRPHANIMSAKGALDIIENKVLPRFGGPAEDGTG